MKGKKAKASLGDVAKAAGPSKTSAACTLQNLPGVNPETCQRVLQIAQRLNYFPDPRLTSRMAGIRHTASKDLLPVVWLKFQSRKETHGFLFELGGPL